jgi:hypothetical protein
MAGGAASGAGAIAGGASAGAISAAGAGAASGAGASSFFAQAASASAAARATRASLVFINQYPKIWLSERETSDQGRGGKVYRVQGGFETVHTS